MSEENYTSQNSVAQGGYSANTSSLPYIDTPPQPSHDHQVQQPPEQPAKLTEIDQLAATHHLGKVEQEYENNAERHLVAGIPFLLLGAILLFYMPYLFHIFDRPQFVGLIRGMVWAIVGGVIALSYGISRVTRGINNAVINMRHHNPHIFLYTHGMIIKGEQVQVVPWNQVKAVQKIFYADKPDIPYQFLFYLSEGKEPIVLNRVVIRFKILCGQIERALAPQLLARATADHKSGQTLDFDAISVTPQGLNIEQKSLPWGNIGDLDEQKGYLIIKEKETASLWAEIDESTMLNRCIFLPLVKQLRSDYYKRAAAQKPLPYQPLAEEIQSEWQEYE